MVVHVEPDLLAEQADLRHSLAARIFHSDSDHPGLPSTIGDLPSYSFRVSPFQMTQFVVRELERRPELPGVLIVNSRHCVGMVSRRKCLELLSRPYGTEVFLCRPIIVLYEQLGLKSVSLPANTRIHRAVQIALSRPFHQLYEPIVVDFGDDQIKILDLHILLLAQSFLLANANSLIEQQIEIGRVLSSTLELDQVLDLILQHMAEIVPYDRAAVMLQNDGWLEFVACRGFPPQVDTRQLQIETKESDIYQQICRSKQPLSIPDVSQKPDWQYVEQLPEACSWMGAPLIHADRVIGMLSLTRLVADDYGEEELALAQTFAGQAAIALQNARLYQEIKRFNRDLESMVQERTEALQAAYDKLERLDRSKSDFIGVASHELRTPLTVMSGYAQMLLADPTLQANKGHAQMLSGIYTGTQRLHEIVNSMLDVTRIDYRTLDLCQEMVQFSDLAGKLREAFGPLAAERDQILEIKDMEHLPPIQADSEALYKVFDHLIVNAIKFTPDGGRITVAGRFIESGQDEPVGDAVEIIVSDTGIGIDPDQHELIFEKFYQAGEVSLHSSGRTKFKGGGPGLGLAIVRGIVNAHGGRVWVESDGYDEKALPGSQFHVLLPLVCDC